MGHEVTVNSSPLECRGEVRGGRLSINRSFIGKLIVISISRTSREKWGVVSLIRQKLFKTNLNEKSRNPE